MSRPPTLICCVSNFLFLYSQSSFCLEAFQLGNWRKGFADANIYHWLLQRIMPNKVKCGQHHCSDKIILLTKSKCGIFIYMHLTCHFMFYSLIPFFFFFVLFFFFFSREREKVKERSEGHDRVVKYLSFHVRESGYKRAGKRKGFLFWEK